MLQRPRYSPHMFAHRQTFRWSVLLWNWRIYRPSARGGPMSTTFPSLEHPEKLRVFGLGAPFSSVGKYWHCLVFFGGDLLLFNLSLKWPDHQPVFLVVKSCQNRWPLPDMWSWALWPWFLWHRDTIGTRCTRCNQRWFNRPTNGL